MNVRSFSQPYPLIFRYEKLRIGQKGEATAEQRAAPMDAIAGGRNGPPTMLQFDG